MKSIDNQPIIFTDADELNLDCSCNSSSYSQLVDFDDRIYFQLESSPCNGRLQPFDTSIESWINTDGIICGTGGYGNWIQFFYFD